MKIEKIDLAQALGDTWGEKLETIYIKIFEALKEFEDKDIIISVGRKVAESLGSGKYTCLPTSQGRFHMGQLYHKWEYYLDGNLEEDVLEIESSSQKVKFFIENLF